jgi:hypothetical protein
MTFSLMVHFAVMPGHYTSVVILNAMIMLDAVVMSVIMLNAIVLSLGR